MSVEERKREIDRAKVSAINGQYNAWTDFFGWVVVWKPNFFFFLWKIYQVHKDQPYVDLQQIMIHVHTVNPVTIRITHHSKKICNLLRNKNQIPWTIQFINKKGTKLCGCFLPHGLENRLHLLPADGQGQ